MEPRVSMTAGIASISRTAKKHREYAKKVVTVAGMDRTAIIVSKNKIAEKSIFIILVKMQVLPKEFEKSSTV